MDSDTMSRPGSHQRVLDAFRDGAIHILLGTQMIAKGLDFPNVTLVGVVNADVGLHLPDFRSAEKTFQLLAQVAGRTGRGDRPGRVLVQTFCPDHYAIHCASRHDYEGFVARELPDAVVVSASSTAAAAQEVALPGSPYDAAIAARIAGEPGQYGFEDGASVLPPVVELPPPGTVQPEGVADVSGATGEG
jgi:hypothetical protein